LRTQRIYLKMPRIALTVIRGYLRGTRTECCCTGWLEKRNCRHSRFFPLGTEYLLTNIAYISINSMHRLTVRVRKCFARRNNRDWLYHSINWKKNDFSRWM